MRWCWVNFQCRGVLLIWLIVGQGLTALAVGADGGCLDIFTLLYLFSPLSPSLWETARYRLKYCLKGPLNPKQPTNQMKVGRGARLIYMYMHIQNTTYAEICICYFFVPKSLNQTQHAFLYAVTFKLLGQIGLNKQEQSIPLFAISSISLSLYSIVKLNLVHFKTIMVDNLGVLILGLGCSKLTTSLVFFSNLRKTLPFFFFC